jgi:hypothetical protein
MERRPARQNFARAASIELLVRKAASVRMQVENGRPDSYHNQPRNVGASHLRQDNAITGRLLLRDRQLKRFFDLMNLKKGLVVETRAVLFGGGPVLPGWTARTRCDSLRREQLSLHWVFRLR